MLALLNFRFSLSIYLYIILRSHILNKLVFNGGRSSGINRVDSIMHGGVALEVLLKINVGN